MARRKRCAPRAPTTWRSGSRRSNSLSRKNFARRPRYSATFNIAGYTPACGPLGLHPTLAIGTGTAAHSPADGRVTSPRQTLGSGDGKQ
jgi:hypothetical protein